MLVPDIDIDLGVAGDPHGPVTQAFARRGVRVCDRTIKNLRAGTTNPVRTAFRLACVDKLRTNDASLKNQLLLRVIRQGIELRRPSPEPHRPYTYRGLSHGMEAALGCRQDDLTLIVRVMRADFAIWTTHTWDDELVTRFRSAAATYLRVHSRPTLGKLGTVHDYINAAWDKHTIHGFYFAFYHFAHSTSPGSWLPYELDLLLRFYARQEELGNPLTPLDRQALQGAANHQPGPTQLASMVRAHVGVANRPECVAMQRRMLATGSFEPVAIPRSLT